MRRKNTVASALPTFEKTGTGVSAAANGPGAVAAAAGRDVNFHYGGKKRPRGRPKSPPDLISEDQAAKLKHLMDEIIELGSASPEGKDLTLPQLRQKWWGALSKRVPGSSYTNYSQAKYKRALNWARQHRGRLFFGAGSEEPALAARVMIRGIHTFISRNDLNKRACYDDWSNRLDISPPFVSTKDLTYEDLKGFTEQ